jgi:putative hydrolases of HD superfamily
MNIKRDIEFLYELGSLRNMQRGWTQHFGMDCANDMEHTLRVAWLAMMLGRYEGEVNEGLILKMALIHDLGETRTLDFSYVQKVYVKADEENALCDTLEDTVLEDFNKIFAEYEKRECIEAKLVKDADNLDVELELKELEEKGSKLPEKWKQFRLKIRNEKLYTESAKKFWEEIQNSSPADWHIKANKWVKVPDAGK